MVPGERARFAQAISEATEDAAKLAALQASGLADCVATKRNDLATAIGKIRTSLGCDAPAPQPGCSVTFRYIVQIFRGNPPDDVFVQTATAAALIRAEPRLVGLNLVGAEEPGGTPRHIRQGCISFVFSVGKSAGRAARG